MSQIITYGQPLYVVIRPDRILEIQDYNSRRIIPHTDPDKLDPGEYVIRMKNKGQITPVLYSRIPFAGRSFYRKALDKRQELLQKMIDAGIEDFRIWYITDGSRGMKTEISTEYDFQTGKLKEGLWKFCYDVEFIRRTGPHRAIYDYAKNRKMPYEHLDYI